MKVLVFNCGSSSIKYQLFDMPAETILAKGMVERIGEAKSVSAQKAEGGREIKLEEPVRDHEHGLRMIERMLTDPAKGAIKSLAEIGACGHRVVHGAEAVSGSVVIDDALEKSIEQFADLAPLHNPPNLVGIRAARKTLGAIPQVACFDTAFHQTIPEAAYLYALPYELYEKFRVRRYGFHGTSHRYVARRAATMLGRGKYDINAITCHLGNGSSMAAVRAGKSVDTSMGLTPLEGLIMGTRTGDFDPAIIFYLIRKGYTADDIDKLCNKKSGVLGISGTSNDMRDLEQKAAAGDRRAALALEMFAYRLRKYIGSYMAVLNGCDAIVFTGGIGERAPVTRRQALENMENLGVVLDLKRNDEVVGREGSIHADSSKVKILVIPTNEELAIARDTFQMASGNPG
ncbi:MAG: acetate kinase [Lentisphaerae bacterium RIFOXYC12_FULL_60_16]|nr:MAG: acetate kinase [Lentisphaerae bacterium RIFOXYC12_FULL_60_16]OGV75159.1 MAG: acetate kinase [Lentisphaerae bacterium RIFOXYB12_FULL_60_10]